MLSEILFSKVFSNVISIYVVRYNFHKSVYNFIVNILCLKNQLGKCLELNKDERFLKSCIVFKSYSSPISATNIWN